MTDHLSRFQLERLAADDPRVRIRPAHHVHVASCDRCRIRLRALLAARARFLDTQYATIFPYEVVARAERLGPEQRSPWWVTRQFVRGAVGVLAVAMLVLTWFAHDAAARWSRGVAQRPGSAGVQAHEVAQQWMLRSADEVRRDRRQ